MVIALSKNWNSLIKPTVKVLDNVEAHNANQKTLIVEPLERGFAITLGNSLRRIRAKILLVSYPIVPPPYFIR